MTLAVAAVRVGPRLPVETQRTDPEEHRRILAEAINLIGVGLFTHKSELVQQSGEDTISTASWTDLSGLTDTVVSPVPARLVARAELLLEIDDDDAENGGAFHFRLVQGATAISTEMVYRSRRHSLLVPGQTGYQPLTVQATLDLDVKTEYTIKAQAKGATGNEVWKVKTPSTMLLRVEPRSLR